MSQRNRRKQPARGSRKPPAQKKPPPQLPPQVPEGWAITNGDLMARLGRLQLELDAASERETALREQNAEFRAQLVAAGLAAEPVVEPDGEPAEKDTASP